MYDSVPTADALCSMCVCRAVQKTLVLLRPEKCLRSEELQCA